MRHTQAHKYVVYINYLNYLKSMKYIMLITKIIKPSFLADDEREVS
jgi:hypothetical protein